MSAVFAVDACRTPIGRIKGVLSGVRPDHLAAGIVSALVRRNPWLDPAAIDDVYWGAANQAGEDNRNVGRMAILLAGLPVTVPGATVNRLCGSGLMALNDGARGVGRASGSGGVAFVTRAACRPGAAARP